MIPLKSIAFFGYSVPGSILALSILMTAIQIMEVLGVKWQLVMTNSLLLLFIGFFIRFGGVIQNVLSGSLDKQNYTQIEIARMLKKSYLTVYKDLLIRNMTPALVSAGILVFVEMLKELPLTLLLRPFNYDTLPTAIFQLASDEMVDQSAPYILLIISFSLIPILVINKLTDK